MQVCGLTQHAELAGAPGYDCIVGGVQGGQGKGQVSQGETFEMAKLAVLGEQARSAGLGERRHDARMLEQLLRCRWLMPGGTGVRPWACDGCRGFGWRLGVPSWIQET